MSLYSFIKIGKRGNKNQYTPKFSKMSRTNLSEGDTVVLPMEKSKRGLNCLWESGCRSLKGTKTENNRPFGIVIADRNDHMMDAIGYNRNKRGERFIQALVPLQPNSHVYFGTLDIKRNSLSLRIRVVQMKYIKPHTATLAKKYPDASLGEFQVVRIFRDYQSTEDSVPAQRLIKKLYATQVSRAYFANSWGFYKGKDEVISDIVARVSDSHSSPLQPYTDYVTFVDDVEQYLADLAGTDKDKPLVVQTFDFDKKRMSIRCIIGATDIGDIVIDEVSPDIGLSIAFDDIDTRFNHFLTLGKDMNNIKFLFDVKDRNFKSVQTGDNQYSLIRTFKG